MKNKKLWRTIGGYWVVATAEEMRQAAAEFGFGGWWEIPNTELVAAEPKFRKLVKRARKQQGFVVL